jgi:hypothetical protein
MHDVTAATVQTGKWVRLGALASCLFGSSWLYRILIRLVPRLTSAEPTGMSEVLGWVRPMTHETLQSIQHRTHGLWYTGEFIGCCAALFAIYALVLWMASLAGRSERWFIVVAMIAPAIFMGRLICAPAMLSSDVYAYAHYGQLLAVQHVDAHGPAAKETAGKNTSDIFSLDGYYDFVPSVYGPFWTVISAGIVLAGSGHVGLTVLMFRLLEAACAFGSAGLIWAILGRLAPERALVGTLLFLWNPLVIVETGLGGHNDMCMMLLALLAVWLHLRGWKVIAVVALAFSALVKVITWPLVLLYGLVLLHTAIGWKERASLLARAGLATAAAVAVSALLARMNPDGLIAHTASSAQFYENNYHEPLFKAVRHLLGEPADSLEAPMDFHTYWLAANSRAVLHDEPANKSADLCKLNEMQPLLAISDEDSDDWMRVYDPATHMQGYVDWGHLLVIDDPPIATTDSTVRRLSGWPQDWPTVIRANWWIRTVTWGLFVAFGLLAAWKTRDLESYLIWGTWFFIASQLLVFTKIWPWYVIWPLAYGALMPRGAGARLAVMLSAGMLTMYALLDFTNSPWDWLYEYRSIPTIVLPVVLFLVLNSFGKLKPRMLPAKA